MYKVLLLHEKNNYDVRVKEYLALGECYIEVSCMADEEYLTRLHGFDVVLMDCNDIMECLKSVRRIRSYEQFPIVVLSELDDEWEKIRLFQNGIDDYLVKPCWQGELLARVQAHVDRYKRLTKPFGVIKVEELELNTLSRIVTLAGKEIDLRPKEYELLLYLTQHMDEVITKKELYEMVWKDGLADEFYNTVAVHVKKLREKIEKDITNPRYIQTVWGVGYMLRS
ncbi:MAG: response regulator transcription factor [Lachnospiraceae bacterium]|nr:response regulator transcription factor [Lachnospiraceae bacterium]